MKSEVCRISDADTMSLSCRVAGFLAEQGVTQLLLLTTQGQSALMPRLTDLPGLLVERLATGHSPVRLHSPTHGLDIELTEHEARVFAGAR